MLFHTLFFYPFRFFLVLFINTQYYFLDKHGIIAKEVKNMREKLRNFMIGRYGIDDLSKFLMGFALVLCILDIFVNNAFLSLLFFVLIIYVYFRMLSRNYNKRYQENMKFLQVKNKVVAKFDSQKWMMQQRKTHHIYKCPTCNQKIRIPKGKGRICITCPKCKTEFTKTS